MTVSVGGSHALPPTLCQGVHATVLPCRNFDRCFIRDGVAAFRPPHPHTLPSHYLTISHPHTLTISPPRTLARSLPPSLSHTLTPSLSHYIAPLFSRSLLPSLSHYLTPSPPHSSLFRSLLPHSLTPSLPHSLAPSLPHYLTLSLPRSLNPPILTSILPHIRPCSSSSSTNRSGTATPTTPPHPGN